ncbi:MAG: NAD(P)H-dependent oxidoreductase [Nanoarchaeota archaeon]
MKNLKIKIILGTTRKNRFSDKTSKWVLEEAKKKDWQVELLDLRDYPMPFYDEPVSPAYVKEGNYANEMVRTWAKKIDEADAYIIITPEYNHGPSAVLKNAMDHVYSEWNNKPVAFVSHGASAGGSRAVEQLRTIAIELQMAPIRVGVHIPFFWTQVDDKGNLKTEQYQETLQNLFTQLTWWAKALKAARKG